MTTQTTKPAAENKAQTDAERYPLITNPTFRQCVDAVIMHVESRINSMGGPYAVKSCAATQLMKAGNLNASFCLQHFAGIFDGNSPLSSAQRRFIKAVLTDAAAKMTQMVMAAKAKAQEEEAKRQPAAPDPEQEGGPK